MIGIVADPADREMVEEFFQLFKTPWEYYRSSAAYAAVIAAADGLPGDCRAPLTLLYGAGELAWDRQQGVKAGGVRGPVALSYRNQLLPIYGPCACWARGEHAELLESDSAGQRAADQVFHHERTVVRIGYDLFREVRHLLTAGQSPDMAGSPTLDRHIAYLRDQLLRHGAGLVEIPPVPAGYGMMACLTHDVDHPRIGLHRFDHTMWGFLYRATIGSVMDLFSGRTNARNLLRNWTAAGKLPLVYLGLAEDFWTTFRRYNELEAERGSTYFVIPFKQRPGLDMQGKIRRHRGAGYEPADIADELHGLAGAGREIGLHGLDAWRDSERGKEEQTKVAGFGRAPETGVRMHWLYFDEGSPRKLEAAGFSYDSTFGYTQTVGFRAGTAQAFKPPGVTRLLELPLHIMDTALFYPAYLHLQPDAARERMFRVLDQVERCGGVLVVNWHDRSLAPERLWGASFVQLVDELTRRRAWFPTAATAVSWFRKRRETVFHDVQWDGTGARVRASAPSRASEPAARTEASLPGLRLRVHAPRGTFSGGEEGYVETTFTDEFDARIAW